MTPTQIRLIQASFDSVTRPMAGQAGLLFYQRLLTVDPFLRRQLHTPLEEQAEKLMHMLGMGITALKHLDTLVPILESMGRQYAANGVGESEYVTLGECLLWTLEVTLGAAFNAEVRAAWLAAYELLTGIMSRGALMAVAA